MVSGGSPVRRAAAKAARSREGDHHELIFGRPAHSRRPRLGLRGAEPDPAHPGHRRRTQLGEQVADTMKLAAGDVQTLVIPGCAHWVDEETPEKALAALTAFLAPYRDGAARGTQPQGA